MQTIFFYDLATGKCVMGSSEPLVTPSPDYPNTRQSDIIILDGLIMKSLLAARDLGWRYLQAAAYYDWRELRNLYCCAKVASSHIV
jgi:hypothetical protein